MLAHLDWNSFATTWDWQQGEHVCIIGPTGSGKSTIQRSILRERNWGVVLCTKKRDDTYTRYLSEGYIRVEKWPPPLPPRGETSQHVLLWPKIKKIEDLNTLGPVHGKALNDIFVDEGWTIGLDDLYYLCKVCHLDRQISELNYQVRSMGVTLVSCLQRPAWVPRSTWDQSSHAFIRRLYDANDVRTIRGLSPYPTKTLEMMLLDCGPYEWLYVPVAKGDRTEPVIVKPPL